MGNLTNTLGDVAINVNGLLPGVASTGISFSDNLSANAIKETVFSQQIVVVDDKGQKQIVPSTIKNWDKINGGFMLTKYQNLQQLKQLVELKLRKSRRL